ncbi:hypothetical protein M3484_20800 [Pseudomonas sp. GX19020]|uniref:hypothetical protein n=1 Tax=Pseudomonas sp. GX19020 TaxID=2942277 RepID=UPI0020187C57|nr:hypothetical protein [Pseudomonas sp. GX19020]MCL4069000.1 hypothetical protein [Pseudomonas sp. GX19020]
MSASKTVGRLKAILGLEKAGFSRGLREGETDLKRFEGAAASVGRRLKAALGLSIAGIGFQQLASRARQAVRSIAELGDEAKRSGMSLKSFQEWKYVAEQNRIGIDAVVDGFKELNLRADEFITTGGGSAADAFQRIGFTAADLKAKLKDPSALMLEIIGRLEGIDKAAQIRILDELLGGAGGEQFLQLLGQGEAGMRKLIGRAHEVGAVMSDQMIAKADELDRKFNALSEAMENWAKKSVIAAADAIEEFTNSNKSMLMELMESMDRAKVFLGDDLVNALLASETAIEGNKKTIADLYEVVWELTNSADELETAFIDAADAAFALGNADVAQALIDASVASDALVSSFKQGKINSSELADGLLKVRKNADDALSKLSDVDALKMSGVISEINRLSGAMGVAARLAKSLMGWLASVTGISVSGASGGDSGHNAPVLSEYAPTSGRATKRPELPGVDSYGDWLDAQTTGGGKGGGGGRTPDDYAKAIASIKAETAALQAEAVAFAYVASSGVRYADAVEYARKRAELLAAAQKQGKEVTPELMAQIDALALAYVNAGDAAEKASKQLQQVEANSKTGANAIGNIFGAVLEGSGAAKRAVAQLILEIAKAQMMSAAMGMFGGSGFARFIGGLMNVGANAGGTNNWRGGLTRINELGGEIMNLPEGTQIIPADVSKRIADRAGQSGSPGHLSIGFDRSTGDLTATMRDVAGQVVQQERASIVGQSVAATVRTSRQSKSVLGQR